MSNDNRPRWVNRLHMFIIDDIIDDTYDYPLDGSDDEIHYKIETAVNEVLCGHYGQVIIDDQCGIPEHRFCAYCNRPALAIRDTSGAT